MDARALLAPVAAGFLAALVAYSASFSVIVQGLSGVGASPEQVASGLLVLSVAMGLCGVAYSLLTRMPMNIAWSTPGAAFLAAAGVPEGGFAGAVGAFVVAGALTLVAGLIRPLARAIAAVPASLTSAMLAGILFPLCLAPVQAMAETPVAAGAIALTFVLVSIRRPLFAVPAATVVTIGFMIAAFPRGEAPLGPLLASPVFVAPQFHLSAMIGLGLPLFVISMASQNVPGLSIMRANGYRPAPGPLFATLGTLSAATAPFGVHSMILAAMTAALCAGDAAGPDRSLRWVAGVACGAFYVVFGLTAALIVAFAASAPLLVATIAGLALMPVFAASVRVALERDEEREAAAICFVTTASGIAFFGISAAVWGLAAGGLVLVLRRTLGR